MARAALEGKLRPMVAAHPEQYVTTYGTWVSGYSLPTAGATWGGVSLSVKAETWIFTTDANPKNASVPLRPLYRMSWKCGDSTSFPPAVCSTRPGHIDTILVDKDEVSFFASTSMGYKVDGIEGFVYPKSEPQPLGTVKLMRLYNADLDDHAIFPETAMADMQANGWMYMSGSTDWLGYVYPNINGTMPTIQ
jgi:hypothetical protein